MPNSSSRKRNRDSQSSVHIDSEDSEGRTYHRPSPGTQFRDCVQEPVKVSLDVKTTLDGDLYKARARILPARDSLDCTEVRKGFSDNVQWMYDHSACNSSLQEAKKNKRVCNTQLRIKGASEEECANHPALLTSCDAYALSPILQARLSDWEEASSTGQMVLDLELDVEQAVIDGVVNSIYSKSLLIGPNTVESLFLVADYLQMGWLRDAVKTYMREKLLGGYPMQVSRLANRYQDMELFSTASTLAIKSGVQPLDFVELMELAPNKLWRIGFVWLLAEHEKQFRILGHIGELRRHSHLVLSLAEVKVLASKYPELLVPLAGVSKIRFEGDDEACWAQHYAFHKEIQIAEARAWDVTNLIVWVLPLTKRGKELFHPNGLELKNGRTFTFKGLISPSVPADGQSICIFIEPTERNVWKQGDSFRFGLVEDTCIRLPLNIAKQLLGKTTRASWKIPLTKVLDKSRMAATSKKLPIWIRRVCCSNSG